MVRRSLRVLLSGEGHEVVEAAEGWEAVRLAGEVAPDVVVMDLHLPDVDGLEATRRIVSANPQCRVVVLTAVTDPGMVSRAIVSGASAYVPKLAAFEELVRALRAAAAGERYVSPLVPTVGAGGAGGAVDGTRLSPREKEVLKLLADGYATKEVAAELGLSVKTAETHRRNIMEKLDIDSIAGLTKYAIRHGLTTAGEPLLSPSGGGGGLAGWGEYALMWARGIGLLSFVLGPWSLVGSGSGRD